MQRMVVADGCRLEELWGRLEVLHCPKCGQSRASFRATPYLMPRPYRQKAAGAENFLILPRREGGVWAEVKEHRAIRCSFFAEASHPRHGWLVQGRLEPLGVADYSVATFSVVRPWVHAFGVVPTLGAVAGEAQRRELLCVKCMVGLVAKRATITRPDGAWQLVVAPLEALSYEERVYVNLSGARWCPTQGFLPGWGLSPSGVMMYHFPDVAEEVLACRGGGVEKVFYLKAEGSVWLVPLGKDEEEVLPVPLDAGEYLACLAPVQSGQGGNAWEE